MILLIKSGWEMVKTYIFYVVLRKGIISFDRDDFASKAKTPKIAMTVIFYNFSI